MLFKLLKYDLRSMWKQLSLVWGAALVLALVNRLTHSLGFMVRARDFENHIAAITAFALMAVFVTMFIISVVFVLQRFYRGLLGGEGYLMHTLPVRAWELVASKMICAIVTYIGSGIVAVLSILLMITTDWWEFFFNFPLWTDILRGIIAHPDIIPFALEVCLLALAAIVQSVAAFYLAMALGHLFSRRRVLASIVSYIGIYILLSKVYNRVFSWNLVRLLIDTVEENVHTSLLTVSAVILVPAVVFLAAVCWILEHKLNLE